MIHKNTPLKEVLELAPSCTCSSCSSGCKYGSGLLVESDIKSMAGLFLKISEDELKKEYLEEAELFNKKMLRPKQLRKGNKPYGQCVFYDCKKGCTIHEAKPLQCKTSISCKDYGEELGIWFMANHIIDANDPESIRQFAQYIKSGGKLIPGASLNELVPDEERLKKILSYEILK